MSCVAWIRNCNSDSAPCWKLCVAVNPAKGAGQVARANGVGSAVQAGRVTNDRGHVDRMIAGVAVRRRVMSEEKFHHRASFALVPVVPRSSRVTRTLFTTLCGCGTDTS